MDNDLEHRKTMDGLPSYFIVDLITGRAENHAKWQAGGNFIDFFRN